MVWDGEMVWRKKHSETSSKGSRAWKNADISRIQVRPPAP